MTSGVTVTVPATTANIGPGFDCLGAALSLQNQFRLSQAETTTIIPRGTEAARVFTDERNLAYQAICYCYDFLDADLPPIQLEIELGVPLARGLGSSATAIVGGLVGANALLGNPLSQAQLLNLAIEMEGHPDNVAPALLGGCCLAASGLDDNQWIILHQAWDASIIPVIAIPDFELSTATARQVLPPHLAYSDAIFNAAHLGILLEGLRTGHAPYLQAGLQDRLHQPYRQALIPGYEAVQTAALNAGAYGLVISGAGPTLLALTSADRATTVAQKISQAWADAGISCHTQVCQINTQGTVVHSQIHRQKSLL